MSWPKNSLPMILRSARRPTSNGRQYLLALTTDGHLRVYQPLEQGEPLTSISISIRALRRQFSAATGELAVVFDSAAPTIEIYKITTDESAH